MMRHRWLIALAAIATVLTLVVTLAPTDADARAGRGFSFGSRGARTFTAPPATRTAPTAAPVQRSATQPASAATAAQATARPGLLGGGMFGGGLLGGLAAGFIGAGLFGMLFGHGFLGGMGGFASILGLILQVVLVIWVARLAFAWWQRRNGAPAFATQAASPAPGAGTQSGPGFAGFGGVFGANAPAGEPITIGKPDYDAFEALLIQVQDAYSAEDEERLRSLATPEVVGYFAEQQQEYGSRGLVNRVGDVKLLNGDLAEAWREGNAEYATVAMHFALTDSVVERASGRMVEGGSPSEATELWTFTRARGGDWLLAAIQQA